MWKHKNVRKIIFLSRLSSESFQHGIYIEKVRNIND